LRWYDVNWKSAPSASNRRSSEYAPGSHRTERSAIDVGEHEVEVLPRGTRRESRLRLSGPLAPEDCDQHFGYLDDAP